VEVDILVVEGLRIVVVVEVEEHRIRLLDAGPYIPGQDIDCTPCSMEKGR
jgi:hypothetical protein